MLSAQATKHHRPIAVAALCLGTIAVQFDSAVNIAFPDLVRAFALPPLAGFALHRGTWHWGPFPLGEASVHLWNVQGKRYAEDNACADLVDRLHTTLEITG